MSIYKPFYIVVRIIVYSLLMAGVFLAVKYDALYPMGEGYFGELSFTEISQEIILFILFGCYLFLGRKYKQVRPVVNILSLLFLIMFIREFNFFIDWWLYPVLFILVVIGWLTVRDYKMLKSATVEFFTHPASAWFLAGLIVTCVFSRLFGQSAFWRILYDESIYRLAKAATEEGIELLGDTLMLISGIEFIFILMQKNKGLEK